VSINFVVNKMGSRRFSTSLPVLIVKTSVNIPSSFCLCAKSDCSAKFEPISSRNQLPLALLQSIRFCGRVSGLDGLAVEFFVVGLVAKINNSFKLLLKCAEENRFSSSVSKRAPLL
jgi:hypothetical protein